MGQLEIINFLKANINIWFNIEQISLLCGMNYPQTCKCINKLQLPINPNSTNLEVKHEEDYRTGGRVKSKFIIKYVRYVN